MVQKISKLIRINSRIRPDQDKYIKIMASKKDPVTKEVPTEGEVYRSIIDFYMKNNPQK